jgi:cysteine desulfurase/selenocysteine lyase
LPVDDRVTAQSFGLPGADELRALLAGDSRQPVAATPAQGNSHGYYFVEEWPQHGKAPDFDRKVASRGHGFDVNAVRRDFPILAERVNGKPLIWLDNAATTHKPQAVIDRLAYFYQHENSNIHRAAHELAARATDAYEAARNKVARFIGSPSPDQVIFVRGATEAINLVANTWGARTSARAMKSWCRSWSTTPTSCPGKCWQQPGRQNPGDSGG